MIIQHIGIQVDRTQLFSRSEVAEQDIAAITALLRRDDSGMAQGFHFQVLREVVEHGTMFAIGNAKEPYALALLCTDASNGDQCWEAVLTLARTHAGVEHVRCTPSHHPWLATMGLPLAGDDMARYSTRIAPIPALTRLFAWALMDAVQPLRPTIH